MKTLVLIHGFARSGKTTLLKELKAQGYQVLSTSQELDWITIEQLGLPRYFIQLLRDKDDAAIQSYFPGSSIENLNCRELKIYVAEKHFVPKYGRTGLINRTIAQQYNPYDPQDLIFFETIGGEEARLTKRSWMRKYGDETIDINLRGDRELTGVDIRKLSPNGIEVWNSYENPLELAYRVYRAIKQKGCVTR